jgi:hypothetical protein
MKESLKQIKKIDDQYLIKNIQEGKYESECLNEIVNRHSGIYLDIIHKYYKDNDSQLKQDLIMDKEYNIYNTAIKYRPNKSTKFSTYLGSEVKWICLNTYNKNRKNKTEAYSDIIFEQKQSTIDSFDKAIDAELINKVFILIKERFEKKALDIFNLRYVVGKKNKLMPWRLVSEKVGLSIQGCINIHNSTMEQVKNLIKKDIS